MDKSIKVIFFGNSEFGIPTLKLLKEASWCEIVLVVTQPDSPVGRRKILTPTPIKTEAIKQGLSYTENINDLPAADIGVLVSYGKILKKETLNHFKHGIINIHPSLLPLWRGPAPIQHALQFGDTTTGITVMKIDSGVDTGPWLEREEVNIGPTETALELSNRLAVRGAELLIATMPKYCDGALQLTDQANAKATHSKIITRKDGKITGMDDPEVLYNKWRAYTPWPGIFGIWEGQRLKILDAHLESGEFIIDKLQCAGKNPVTLADFKKGHPNFLFTDII